MKTRYEVSIRVNKLVCLINKQQKKLDKSINNVLMANISIKLIFLYYQ